MGAALLEVLSFEVSKGKVKLLRSVGRMFERMKLATFPEIVDC